MFDVFAEVFQGIAVNASLYDEIEDRRQLRQISMSTILVNGN
jgi:hypothetical protein